MGCGYSLTSSQGSDVSVASRPTWKGLSLPPWGLAEFPWDASLGVRCSLPSGCVWGPRAEPPRVSGVVTSPRSYSSYTPRANEGQIRARVAFGPCVERAVGLGPQVHPLGSLPVACPCPPLADTRPSCVWSGTWQFLPSRAGTMVSRATSASCPAWPTLASPSPARAELSR